MSNEKSKHKGQGKFTDAVKPEKDPPKIQTESKKKSSNPENKKQDDQKDT